MSNFRIVDRLTRFLLPAVGGGLATRAPFGEVRGRDAGAERQTTGRAALCASQTDAGAGVQDHQIGNGVPTVFPARPRQRARRVESRDDVMEHKETIHSEDRLNGRKSLVPPPKRGADGVKSAFEVEVRIREAPFRRPGASNNRLPHLQRKPQSDRLLACCLKATCRAALDPRSPERRGPGQDLRAGWKRRGKGSADRMGGLCREDRAASASLQARIFSARSLQAPDWQRLREAKGRKCHQGGLVLRRQTR